MTDLAQDLADVPFFVPTGPKTLKEGTYLGFVKKAQVSTIKNVKKLVVTYEALWAEDESLHDVIGHKITDFMDLDGANVEIGLERVNRLRIAIDKTDCKSSAEFEGCNLMFTVKKNKKNDAYLNLSYVNPVSEKVVAAYNAYCEKHNAALEAQKKADGYDPEVGF